MVIDQILTLWADCCRGCVLAFQAVVEEIVGQNSIVLYGLAIVHLSISSTEEIIDLFYNFIADCIHVAFRILSRF